MFTEMLSQRYDFDLIPYYPLVLTAFLLLTSIIIVGGLAAFLVLDEVDAGTLTALRVTPVPLSTLLRLSCGHCHRGDHNLRDRDHVVQRDTRTGPDPGR